jgi:hypothetical protein
MRSLTFACLLTAIPALALSGCAPSTSTPAGSLQVEEHELAEAPEIESRAFRPLQGTMDEVLAAHAAERAATFPNEVGMVEGGPAITSLGESGDLLAVMTTATEGQPEQTVTVFRGDEAIFETTAGLPSPVLPLRGLWTYGGHWALEILLADETTWAGQVFIDGELVNEQEGYDEAFGFQLLAGEPFFFYVRENRVGYVYGGQETDLAFDEVPHYRCCSESTLNPVQAENMVAFFAMRGQTWFYVELGRFDG